MLARDMVWNITHAYPFFFQDCCLLNHLRVLLHALLAVEQIFNNTATIDR